MKNTIIALALLMPIIMNAVTAEENNKYSQYTQNLIEKSQQLISLISHTPFSQEYLSNESNRIPLNNWIELIKVTSALKAITECCLTDEKTVNMLLDREQK